METSEDSNIHVNIVAYDGFSKMIDEIRKDIVETFRIKPLENQAADRSKDDYCCISCGAQNNESEPNFNFRMKGNENQYGDKNVFFVVTETKRGYLCQHCINLPVVPYLFHERTGEESKRLPHYWKGQFNVNSKR